VEQLGQFGCNKTGTQMAENDQTRLTFTVGLNVDRFLGQVFQRVQPGIQATNSSKWFHRTAEPYDLFIGVLLM